jgi:hypothetical protein
MTIILFNKIKIKKPGPLKDLVDWKEKQKCFCEATFLRWYDPDQVQRVKNFPVFSQPVTGHP